MKKILLTLGSVLFLATVGLAQTPQNTAKDAPSIVPKVEEKTKPVIITNAKKQELIIASLQLENAKLKLKEFQAEVVKAEDNVAAFWKSVGVDPTKLATEWQASDGQNGDIILTKREPEKKSDTPKQ